MELIFISISCICNSVAIVLLVVLHIRENRRGMSPTMLDMKPADALRRYYDKVVNYLNPYERLKTQSHD